MAKRLEVLTAREVQKASTGEHSDGGGLLLRVDGELARWVLRYSAPSGTRRRMGLGECERHSLEAAGRSLKLARQLARDARTQLAQGIDPIDRRRERREASRAVREAERAATQRERQTLARVARDYHERVIEPKRSLKHASDWINSLENHMPSAIWNAPVDSISAPDVLDFLTDLHNRVPETASRVRQRLEAVFDDAEFRKLCSGNPARAIRRKLTEVHGGRKEQQSLAALAFADAPAFMSELRQRDGVAARALEFGILTAARTGEIIGAQWSEFDLHAMVWTISGGRMKGKETHTVYLSSRAKEIVEAQRGLDPTFVFPSPMLDGKPLSNMAMLVLL